MSWTSYESGIEGTYTLDGVRRLYETADKSEYPDFEGWLWDMERSAVLYRHEN